MVLRQAGAGPIGKSYLSVLGGNSNVPLEGFRQIAGLAQFPNSAVVNSSSFTQFQGRKSFFTFKSGATQLKVQVTNSFMPVTGEVTMPTATCKFSLFDPATSTYYPVLFSGADTIVMASGQIATSDAVTIPATVAGVGTNGKKWFLIKYIRYATAPPNFPGTAVVCTSFDFNEWGNNLTDKTASGSFAASFAATADIFPAISIVSNFNNSSPVVGILGNSITSDAVSSPALDYYRGWAMLALSDLGIPYVNIGTSSLATWVFLGPVYDAVRPRLFQNLATAGVTHLLMALASGDLASLRSVAQLRADLNTLQGMLDPYGIKMIPTTPEPRTDITNTAEREVGSWAIRDAYIADIIANNGVGYGYFDTAAGLADPGNSNLYRTDVRAITSATVSAGGTGYGTNALLYLPENIRLRVSTISGSAVATVSVRDGGGFLVDPTSPVAVLDSIASVIAGGPSGTGATFTYVSAAVPLLSADGIHPGNAANSYQKGRFVTAIQAGLFT